MRRLTLSVCLLVLLALAAMPGTALPQPQDPDMPVDAVEDGQIEVSMAVQLAAAELNVTFIYHPGLLGGRRVGTSDTAMPAFERPEQWWDWLAVILPQIGMGWVRAHGELPIYRIAELDELGRTAAPLVTDLDNIPPDVFFGTLVIPLRRCSSALVQRAMLQVMTRPGGVIQQYDHGVMISDHREQLPRIYAIVRAMDAVDDGDDD